MIPRGLAAAGATLVLLMPAILGAHASLERTEPRVSSRVKSPPRLVKLWFTENLEPAFSTARVLDVRGARVDLGDARVDDTNPALLRVGLTPLTAGTYRVSWRVVSVDTHVSEGDFTFVVAP
jgi:methionine-rich copper-binding protein CopC